MISPGTVAWADLDPVKGREQGGRRPVLVVSSPDFSDVMTDRVFIVPCTKRDRGWNNHVEITGPTGLPFTSFAMTEQPRMMSTERIHGVRGQVDPECLRTVCEWVHQWIYSDPPLPAPSVSMPRSR